MSKTFTLQVPHEIDESDWASYLKAQVHEYEDALDCTANEYDNRSLVDGIRVTGVDVGENQVTIYYDVDISAYHGCRDLNYAETDSRDVTAIREGQELTFEVFEPPPPRDTYEEF